MPLPTVCRIGKRFAVVLSALMALTLFAADPGQSWRVRPWVSDDGLPDNSVAGLAQTPDGYIWVGTPSGLARFDGNSFETVSLTNLVALPNRGIITMMTGNHGGLWLAMDRGAVVYLNKASSHSYAEALPSVIPYDLAEAADDTCLVSYRSGKVYEIARGQVRELTAKEGLPAGAGNCALAADRRGRIWFAKSDRVGIFENGKFWTLHYMKPASMQLATAREGGVWLCSGFHLYQCDEEGNLRDFGQFTPENSGTTATAMLEDQEGAVWIGTSFSGLFRRDQTGFTAIPTTHQSILSLMEDHEGNLWAGTYGGGLDRIRRRSIMLEGTGAGLPFSSVQSICEDTNGVIWAVTQNGILVHKAQGGDAWADVPVGNGWPGQATCVTVDAHGTLWVGTRSHVDNVPTHSLYFRRNGRFQPWSDDNTTDLGTIHTLLAGQSGDIWMGRESPGAVLKLHDGRIETFPAPPDSRIIRAMAEDADGHIWVGTSKGILLRVAGNRLVDATPRPNSELAPIRCLYATPDGALWIGYAGWGLGCLWNGHYTEISTDAGLYDDYISHIVADGRGWLWFGANRGLFKVRMLDLKDFINGRISQVRSVHYGRDEGLPSLQGTFGDSPDVLRDHSGRLWIPMQTALAVADPNKQNTRPSPPPVLLTRVVVDRQVVARYWGVLPKPGAANGTVADLASALVRLHLPPDHRRVEFDFTAPGFREPENIQFQYRLKGVDDDWVAAGTHRSASYPRLPGGKYTFEVTACNYDGKWNPVPARLSLVVSPFFWQTWWFRLLALAMFTAAVIAVVRYVSFRRLQKQLRILAQQSALQRERARIAKDIHDDLGADLTQIALTGELAQQDRAEPEQVVSRLAKISAIARQAVKSLDEIVWAVNPRNDTLAHLIDYAGQFAVDYMRLAGIRCRVDFPDQIPNLELSTDLRHNLFLVIKEALHNVVKHAGATEVWLRARIAETFLEITIEDNGHGFESRGGTTNDALADGLRNMRQRMTDIAGECHFDSRPGLGTRVVLRLPWPKEDSNIHPIV